MGWTMNDLRNQNHARSGSDLAPVTPLEPRSARADSARTGPTLADAGGAGHSNGNGTGDNGRLSFPVSREMGSMPVSARVDGDTTDDALTGEGSEGEVAVGRDEASTEADALAEETAPGPPSAAVGTETRRRRNRPNRRGNQQAAAPASRPARRREEPDEEEPEDDKFPWHFQFEEDEGSEELLHPTSPLLSRAFRSSVG